MSQLGEELVGLRVPGTVRRPPGPGGRYPPGHTLGRRLADRRHPGSFHIAPGAVDRGLRAVPLRIDLPVIAPIDESGRMVSGFGVLEGFSTDEVEDVVIEDLRERDLLVGLSRITRCKVHLLALQDTARLSRRGRLVHLGDEIRQPLLDANATVEWDTFLLLEAYGRLRNMGDWNISRKRYFGLPLPFYPCACGHLTVIGSRDELEGRELRGLDGCGSYTVRGSTTS